MMDEALRSNQPVPIRAQQVSVELLTAGGVAIGSPQSVTTDGSGHAQVADNVAAVMARVTDRFGNVATVALP